MIGQEVSVFFKKEYWNGIILEKDVVWNNKKQDYAILVKDPNISRYLETPYYKDDKLLGYVVYSSSQFLKPPKKKESVLGCFKNLLVIDPQEDCECEIEVYDVGTSQNIVWLRNGLPEVITCRSRIHLPMAKTIEFEQIKQCVLTSLPFAQPISNKDDPYHMILMHPEAEVNKLSGMLKDIFVNCYRTDWAVVCLPEIPKDKIYFSPDQEFLGCFTWNISRYGMFIMPDHLRYCVI